jgi:hypothetical protein
MKISVQGNKEHHLKIPTGYHEVLTEEETIKSLQLRWGGHLLL